MLSGLVSSGGGFHRASTVASAATAGRVSCSMRGPLLRGRTLSREAIAALQRLQNVGNDHEQLSVVINSHVSRLLKADMIQVFENLHRKNQCLAAFELFKLMKREAWYVPNAYHYRRMMELFGKKSMILQVDELFVEYQRIGLPLNTNIFTELMGAYLRCRRPQDAINTFEQMKTLGFKPEQFTYKILVKGLLKNRLLEEAAVFRAEYHLAFEDREFDV